MPDPDLSLLVQAALAAGQVADKFVGKTAKRWDKPDGGGPVTEADLAVNAFLEDTLRSARPDYGWLSEESADTDDRLRHDRVFVVDPIDGTRSFAEGSRTWAHALAIVATGMSVAGVVYLPQRDLMYTAAIGKGAFLNKDLIQVSSQSDLNAGEMLVTRPNLNPKFWQAAVPTFRRAYRPSLAYRMGLVAQGRFDGLLTFRPAWEWDIAAGDIILREAGARCTDRSGQDLRFNNPHPALNGVVAANASLHSATLAAMQTTT